MNDANLWTKLAAEFAEDPLLTISLAAALTAFAAAPIAIAVLGRMDWFQARRGRVLQRPSFASIVVGMALVMGVPAIFAALALKSRRFDENRYEFNPNRTWSVLAQGARYKTLEEADEAVKAEMERLGAERKHLVDGVKKLDQSMIGLRAAAGTSAAVAQAIPKVLESLAELRQSINLDGPQQLMDFTAPPVDVLAAAAASAGAPAPPAAVAPAPTAAPANGLSPAQIAAELATVPPPQKEIAAMLPLADLPVGWVVEKSGDQYVETFNADNLYEKIDGRAESFIQYGVKGMAYTYYHPADDDSKEIQLYVFEMADPLRAFGKFGSEKPDEIQTAEIGEHGYTSAGSLFFHAGKYYTQLVSTQDDPKFAAFALEIGRRVAARQNPGSPSTRSTLVVASAAPTPAPEPSPESTEPKPKPAAATTSPTDYFALLPKTSRQNDPTYVPQDVFGYSFLTEVFMADYKEGDVGWQGFIRPYRDDKEAQDVLDRYVESVKQDGAEVKPLEAEGVDQMLSISNIGLFDVVFRKGNTLAGANGATAAPPAEAFARALAKSLPDKVPVVGDD